jgi:hypothetical protein
MAPKAMLLFWNITRVGIRIPMTYMAVCCEWEAAISSKYYPRLTPPV